jgi:glycosyltransferase involved in cell wall biosynthesis
MFPMTANVSVVIPTFNRWPMLAEAVASVMAQREVNLELIIVDDGSTDETAMRLPSLGDALGTEERPVRILRTENHGPAAARNRGVAAAGAPLVAFLDSDDLWKPDKLKRQIAHMGKNSGCVVSQTDEIWMRCGVRVNPSRRHRKRGGDFFFDSLRTCLISPSAVIMRTSVFRELGGFDQDMRAAEDYDLWLRLLLEHPVELLPEPLVIRRAGHWGQLSAVVPAIDRFRILALLKLLLRNDLGRQPREAVCNALIEKCDIYGNGAARRGNTSEARSIAGLAEMARKAWTRLPDRALECAIDAMRASLARHDVAIIDSRNRNNELGRG